MEVTIQLEELERTLDGHISKLEDQTKQIMLAVHKKQRKKAYFQKDENKDRGNWSGRLEFFLSCLGCSVGLGSVWRFPYLCYKNGGVCLGVEATYSLSVLFTVLCTIAILIVYPIYWCTINGAFFIPYIIMLVFIGMPIVFLEMALGQFTSCGPLTCWNFAPIFQGVGLGLNVVACFLAIYYNMIVAWAFYYLFASFTTELPWEKCRDEWSTEWCFDKIAVLRETECRTTEDITHIYSNNGTCYFVNATRGIWKPKAIYNQTLASSKKIKRTLPSEEYLNREVLKSDFSEGLGDLGPVQWHLVLCYGLAWVVIIVALSKTIKSSGKVVYFTATLPYVVLLILLVRGVLLDNSYEGIDFYIKPDLSRLSEAGIWKDAAVQMFFSLSMGGVHVLASYNRFHNDCLRDVIAVSLGSLLVSLLAGFVIFSYLGHLSEVANVPVNEVAKSGPTLVFVIYPYAITLLPAAPFWSIMFFSMLTTLGLNAMFVMVEINVTSIMDCFPNMRKHKLFTVVCLCTAFFLLGLTLTTEGGVYMLEVMDTYTTGWNILLISMCETLSVGYVYGIRRFLRDIETMVGRKICGFFPYVLCKYWWGINWMFCTPLAVAAIMIYSWVDYTDLKGDKFPGWADAIGWLMTSCVLVCVLAGAVYTFFNAEGTFMQRMQYCFKPTVTWGPALAEHRQEVAMYVPSLVIDPWATGKQQGQTENVTGQASL